MQAGEGIFLGQQSALGLLANLKEARKVKWVCRVEAASIRSVVNSLSAKSVLAGEKLVATYSIST